MASGLLSCRCCHGRRRSAGGVLAGVVEAGAEVVVEETDVGDGAEARGTSGHLSSCGCAAAPQWLHVGVLCHPVPGVLEDRISFASCLGELANDKMYRYVSSVSSPRTLYHVNVHAGGLTASTSD